MHGSNFKKVLVVILNKIILKIVIINNMYYKFNNEGPLKPIKHERQIRIEMQDTVKSQLKYNIYKKGVCVNHKYIFLQL